MKYFIDSEKKIVVAKMTKNEAYIEAYNFLFSYLNKNIKVRNSESPFSFIFGDTLFPLIKPYLSKNYTGKARCSDEDEWNETKGKEIARNRCLARYYRDVARSCDTVRQTLQKATNIMSYRQSVAVNKSVDAYLHCPRLSKKG